MKKTRVTFNQKLSMDFDFDNTNKPLLAFFDDLIQLCQKYDNTFTFRMHHDKEVFTTDNIKYETIETKEL